MLSSFLKSKACQAYDARLINKNIGKFLFTFASGNMTITMDASRVYFPKSDAIRHLATHDLFQSLRNIFFLNK